MARYVSIFFLVIMAVLAGGQALALLLGEYEITLTAILVVLGAFIIAQLFYIIDLLKKKK